MTPLGEFAEGGVRFVRRLAAAPEQVWAYLTESGLIAEWLGHGEIADHVGGPVELRSGGPVIRGTVEIHDRPHALAYGWTVFIPGLEQQIGLPSRVSFALAPEGGETALTLVQAPIDPELLLPSAAGWHALLDMLAASLAGEPAPDFMAVASEVQAAYAAALGLTPEGG
jgi:uncharacterized protein YndB with AHSA1/START domain